jgi:hypothetical protein
MFNTEFIEQFDFLLKIYSLNFVTDLHESKILFITCQKSEKYMLIV